VTQKSWLLRGDVIVPRTCKKRKLQKHMGVSKNKGTPKWMVKIMKKMEKPTIFGNIHIPTSSHPFLANQNPPMS